MFKDLDDKLVPRLASVERKSEKTAGRQSASRRLLPFVFLFRRNPSSSMHTLPASHRLLPFAVPFVFVVTHVHLV